jgi:hypothetical protein
MSEPTKRQIQKNGKECWELDYGLNGQGHRKRPFHQTEPLADAEVDAYRKAVISATTAPSCRTWIASLAKIVPSSGIGLGWRRRWPQRRRRCRR